MNIGSGASVAANYLMSYCFRINKYTYRYIYTETWYFIKNAIRNVIDKSKDWYTYVFKKRIEALWYQQPKKNWFSYHVGLWWCTPCHRGAPWLMEKLPPAEHGNSHVGGPARPVTKEAKESPREILQFDPKFEKYMFVLARLGALQNYKRHGVLMRLSLGASRCVRLSWCRGAHRCVRFCIGG